MPSLENWDGGFKSLLWLVNVCSCIDSQTTFILISPTMTAGNISTSSIFVAESLLNILLDHR